jgi:hypothetical protein
MPRGASPKREHEYEELKNKFEESGRYKGREEEVAARIVNKQRAQYGETKAEKKKDREGKSPDRDLPIPNYQHKTISQIKGALKQLSKKQLQQIDQYESKHKDRKGVHEAIQRQKAA